MASVLPRGANISLQPALAAQGHRLRVVLEWAGDIAPNPSVDALAFCLTDAGKVRGDSDMVFYNNTQVANAAVMMNQPEGDPRGERKQPFTLALDKMPPDITRIVFAVVVDAGGGGVLAVSQLKQLAMRVCSSADGSEIARCEFNLGDAPETALIMGEIYCRKGEWKLKSVGQGFGAGLSALAQSYGVVVADGAQAAGPMSRPSVAPPPTASTAAGRTAVPSIKIDPPHNGFGEVTVSLTWGAPPPPPGTQPPPAAVAKPGGLLGGLLGGNRPGVLKPVDLDLCCLYELNDGYRGVVQALGNNFGAFNSAPFVELMGDERKNKNQTQQTETLRINGKFWGEVRRILPFAMIFEGVPNWSLAGGRATVRVPDQVPISMRLDQNTKLERACSIALIENEGGKMVIHKRVETFKNPRELDQFYSWGLRWTAGMKD